MRRISPPGSANTCGWFDPNELAYVYFGSTIEPPTEHEAPGYQHGSGRYKWAFPATMRIVRHDLNEPAGDATSLTIMAGDDQSYQAEDALSPDGRHLVYCSLESGDGDLYIKDLRSGQVARVVTKPGYDGGPFFSPDGRRLCYRSDRRGDNLLQLFVAELAFDENGSVIGIDREYQLTDNRHVNWAPYWHPGGRHLVYGSSELGHHNYEVFIIDADPGDLPGSTGTIKYGTGKRRLTHADGADIMPTFSADGEYLTWTSQRGASGTSQLWAARFIMPLEARLQDTSGGAAVRGVDGQAASSGGAPMRGGVGEGDPRLSG